MENSCFMDRLTEIVIFPWMFLFPHPTLHLDLGIFYYRIWCICIICKHFVSTYHAERE